MKHYVITILDNEQSVKAAERCIESAARYGLEVEKFKAWTPKDDIKQLMVNQQISEKGFENNKYSRQENCMAAFMSHYTLWQKTIELKQEVTIFEHDAMVLDFIPDMILHQGCINLGKPSYGRWNDPLMFGVNPLTSKRYFPGAHAYRVNPKGAKLLVQAAKEFAQPTDIFLNVDRFPWLEEYYPWQCVANDTFTTIQRQEGCLAKHQYNKEYKII